jgi:hypothetical protein
MRNQKETAALAQQRRVDVALEAVLNFPNFIRWQVFNLSAKVAIRAGKAFGSDAMRVMYEAELEELLAMVAEVNADAQEAEPCVH